MSYFGINVYTDGAEIADDLYTAVKLAYEAYLATQQPSNQYAFDDLFDGITYTPSQPNALRLSGWVFNALKGFANWMNSVNTSSEVGEYQGFEIGTYEIEGDTNYFNAFDEVNIVKRGNYYYAVKDNNGYGIRFIVFYLTGDSYSRGLYYAGMFESNSNLTFQFRNGYNNSVSNTTMQLSYSVNGINYKYVSGKLYDISAENSLVEPSFTDSYDSFYRNSAQYIFNYTYGVNAGSGEATLNDVYALPNPAILDDLIGAADPDDEVTIDLDGSDLAVGTLATLEDLINAVNDLVDTYVVDNSYPETIGKVIAQGLEIVNEITEVEYPDAINWQVPEIIDTPQIIPLITPECPDLSSCLISGVQEVSNTMNEIINIHPDTGNYVTAALYMGLVLLILGSTVL